MLNETGLRYHECMRVFHDRLASRSDSAEFAQILDSVLEKAVQMRAKDLCKGEKDLLFVALPFDTTPGADAPYDEVIDRQMLKQFLVMKLEEYNERSFRGRMNLVLFR